MAFEFYSSFCKCATRKRKIRRKKNEETEPIFEVAYLENARSDFAQIWNVECCSWRACPQQISSCFIKEAQSYGGAKIAFSFFQSIYSRVLRAGFLGHTTHYRVSVVCLDYILFVTCHVVHFTRYCKCNIIT